jgi:hypothetical protein
MMVGTGLTITVDDDVTAAWATEVAITETVRVLDTGSGAT